MSAARVALPFLVLTVGCSGGALVEDDAGTDAGEVITVCEVALEGDAAGRPCAFAFGCGERDDGWCAGRYARCEDGAVRIDEDLSRWWRGALPSCPPAAQVELEGSGPSGAFTLDVGIASFSHAFAVNAYLLFSGGGAFAECGEPRLAIFVQPIDLADYVGTREVSAELALDGELHELTGTVEVTSEERSTGGYAMRLAGTLTLSGAGVAVSGAFDVTECPALDRSGP